MKTRSFTALCQDCKIRTERERSYAQAGFSYLQKQRYEEVAFKSRDQVYKETVRAIRRKNSINILLYLFFRQEINRIAKIVVDWIMNQFPTPPTPPQP